MTLEKGNIWGSGADIICVTTNATVRTDGRLVMGRGAALECKQRFPGIDLEFGRKVRQWEARFGLGTPYGVVLSGPNCLTLGAFQVKWSFRDAAEVELIRVSVQSLTKIAVETGAVIALNFPGIGYGRLSRECVLPLLEPLPDNVTVYEL